MNIFEQMIRGALLLYTEKLGLKWYLRIIVDSSVMGAYGLSSSRELRRHTFRVSPKTVSDYRPVLPVLVTGLYRAYLGETLDPAFAGFSWFPSSSARSVVAEDTLQQISHAVIDTWVNDLRYSHWPALSAQHVSLYRKTAQRTGAKVLQDYHRTLKGIMDTAEMYAQALRHIGHTKGLEALREGLTTEQAKLVDTVRDFLVSLPPLCTDSLEQAIQQFEQTTQKLLELLHATNTRSTFYDMRVKIIYKDSIYGWMITGKEST